MFQYQHQIDKTLYKNTVNKMTRAIFHTIIISNVRVIKTNTFGRTCYKGHLDLTTAHL